MNFTFASIVLQVKNFWNGQTKRRRTIILLSAVVVIVLSIVAAILLNVQNYVVLYRGLSASESSEIVTKLESMSVSTKIQNDGAILVPKADEAKLKMQLSAEGYPKSSLNYDIFSNSSDFMTTDYEKKKYLIFQLQNRLQDSIKTLQGVENAIVTISVSDENSFVLEADRLPATASVVLDLDGSTTLSQKQVSGIEALVSKSVPGLASKNVVIIDNEGVILNNTNSDANIQSAYTKLDMTNSVNEAIKNKIISLLEPVFGKSGMSVAVNVVMDFEKKASEEKTYTPSLDEKGMVSKEQLTKESTTGGTDSGGVPGTNSNTDVETYPESSAGGAGTSTSESSGTEYLVNQLIKSTQSDGGEIKDISVAVILNKEEMADDELEKYKNIVAFGAGISTDKVVITAIEFSSKKAIQAFASDALGQKSLYWKLILGGVIAVLIIGVIILIMTKKRAKKKKKLREAEGEDFYLKDPNSTLRLGKNGKAEVIPGEIILNETREQGLKRQIKDFSSANPDIVAMLLRTWIKEEDNDNG